MALLDRARTKLTGREVQRQLAVVVVSADASELAGPTGALNKGVALTPGWG